MWNRGIALVGAVVAIAACAWFALGWHQATKLSAATRMLDGPKLTAARVKQFDGLLSSGSTLNPDRTPRVLKALEEAHNGDDAAARATILKVARAEPENVQMWIDVYDWTSPADLGARVQLLARIHALQPLN